MKILKEILSRSFHCKIELLINFIGIIIAVLYTFFGMFVGIEINIVIILLGLLLGYLMSKDIFAVIKPDNAIELKEKRSLKFDISDFMKEYDEFIVVGISNEGFLCIQNFHVLQEADENGKKFEFICIAPDADCYSEILQYKTKTKERGSKNSVEFYKKYLSEMNNITLKCCDINLPYGMLIAKKKGVIKYIKVDLYGINIPDDLRRSFIINEYDQQNINFYYEQYKEISKVSTEIK